MAKIDIKQAAGFLFAGAMVGAAAALLYAPHSGARTTQDIKKFARNTMNRLDDLQGDIRDQVADWVDNMAEVVIDGVDRGKNAGIEGYQQVLLGLDNAKKCVEDGRIRIEQLIKSA